MSWIGFIIEIIRTSFDISKFSSNIFVMYSFDCMINIICLYLQYPFATKYYYKYCKCITKLWNNLLIYKAQNALKQKYSNIIQLNLNEDNNCNEAKNIGE